ncbi:MAG: hypothetical protein DHS20C02_01380 [Micavibrio sp.]|nr:MAG: hypothetical protein DHS20C02_01380 [Micavibrio sp.]
MNHNKQEAISEKEGHKILPEDTAMALRKLISLTRSLIESAELEERALTLGDMVQLSSLQGSKEKTAWQYTHSSQEFRKRLEEFRRADRSLLNQLESLQKDLNKKTQSNNILIEQLHQKALANTQATLVTAQELGQPLKFKNGHQQEQQERA